MLWGQLEPNNFNDLYYLEVMQLKKFIILFFPAFIFLILPPKSVATNVVHSK
jgi:hypothetical protein